MAMARVRSPNHPQLDLGAALALARKAFDKDSRNRMSQEALAKHLGHEGLSGPALGKIGALRAYGLIVGSSDELRISDDAVTAMMAPERSAERKIALQRLAFQPSIFQEIRKQFPGAVSEDNLRYWLVKRQFTGDAATKAAKVYLATLRLVGESPEGYISPLDHEEEENMDAGTDVGGHQRTPPPPTKAPPKGSRQAVFPLSDGDVTMTFPADLSADGFDELGQYLDIFLKKQKSNVKAQETPGQSKDDLSDLE